MASHALPGTRHANRSAGCRFTRATINHSWQTHDRASNSAGEQCKKRSRKRGSHALERPKCCKNGLYGRPNHRSASSAASRRDCCPCPAAWGQDSPLSHCCRKGCGSVRAKQGQGRSARVRISAYGQKGGKSGPSRWFGVPRARPPSGNR